MASAVHQCFTVDATSYLRNFDRADLRAPCYAVHYQRPPERTETGVSIGLRIPMLVVTLYLEEQEKVAAKVARILNKHWDDPEDDQFASFVTSAPDQDGSVS